VEYLHALLVATAAYAAAVTATYLALLRKAPPEFRAAF
jgi:hypothetical protein